MGAWIHMVPDAEASTDLLDALAGARTPHGTVDNVLRVHSLRPNTMRGHMKIYKAALHDEGNTIPMWLQETVSSYVSVLNKCEYSLANHWANARHLMGDDAKADAIEADVIALRQAGLDDGQILEANQIICYFNFVNRSINGLGVTTEGDIVGYYAKED